MMIPLFLSWCFGVAVILVLVSKIKSSQWGLVSADDGMVVATEIGWQFDDSSVHVGMSK
jgi:hypothetical protein